MSERLRAAGVHLLTATGAAFALLALIAAKRGDWQLMFIWLGVALIVDTVDGPLARRVGVVKVLPRFSGERLDLIVDFLTYVAVPAFALSQSDLLSEALPLACRHRRHPVELVPYGRPGEQNQGRLFRRLPRHLERRLPLSLRPRPPALRIALHRRVFRRADLRSDPRSTSLPRRRVVLLHLARHGALGGRRHRCRRGSG
jgi:hypothetical protein